MIPAIQEINFPSYATLSQANVSLQEMGDRTISSQIKIDGDVVPSFDGWELRFKGERFILPVKEPQAAKDNSSRRSVIDLTFQSWSVFQMKRYFFVSMSQIDAGTAIPDQYNASVILPIEGFVQLFNKVLQYYFGDAIRMDLFGAGTPGLYSQEPVVVEINKTYIWDVLVKFYELFGYRWRIEYDSVSGAHVIKVNYTAPAITDHDFEYGYQGGLLRFERQVQDTNISNVLIGRGGEKNLPYRYFKLRDSNNKAFAADPDAIPELANIYFDRLRDANFRWYVRGWMQNENRDTSWDATHTFPTYTDADCPEPFLFAFHRGQTDEKFNPIEYVKDDASIAKYGERWGAVEDNDEAFPTIQGREVTGLGRVDEVVDVSPIVTDDIDDAARAAATYIEIAGTKTVTNYFGANGEFVNEFQSEQFSIPEGQVGNIQYSLLNPYNGKTGEEYPAAVIAMELLELKAVNVQTGVETAPDGLTAGSYYLRYRFKGKNYTSVVQTYVTYGFNSLRLVFSSADADAWKPTFDIWVKNIWQSEQLSGESDEEYARRVWEPILGDRAGNEAKVVFSTGFMSTSQDYEFVIASYPVKDRSKTITSGGINYDSEWKITLRKSDAEFEATGLYIPNATTGGAPAAGDHFFFIGIDMPFQYVVWGEEFLNGALNTPVVNKTAALENLADINPSWIIQLDKVRCNTHEGSEYGQHLADRLSAGATVNIRDARFTGGQVLTLYVQSINYVWNEPTDNNPYLVPDIEVVLSDNVVATEGTVTRVSNELEMVKTTYAKSADIEQVVRSIGNALFLKKTGESDRSASPTSFASAVNSENFRTGDFGGAGWGHYEDSEGNSILEVDTLVARKELRVNSLVANQIVHVGGKSIRSAAAIQCTQVVEDSDYYYCYFDQKQGSVANLFQVGDFAMGQDFNENNVETRYYRMSVAGVGVDYIKLAKSGRDGQGAPVKGDTIVQYGNSSVAGRQYVIIEDVIGGGYQRMISGLSTVNAAGKEYYFAGKQNNGERWFVGDANGEHAEWENGQLNVKGRFSVLKQDGTYEPMSDYINSMDYLRSATNEGTLIDGGLVLTSMIQLGYTADQVYHVMAGINGKPDETLSDQTRSIAAWFGGPMVDKDAAGSGSGSGTGDSYAKTLFRMDGSGYMAGGNIFWDRDGNGGIPGITWNNNNIVIGSEVKFVSGQAEVGLVDAVRKLSEMFVDESYTESGTIKHRIKVGQGFEGLITAGYLIGASDGGPGGGSGGGGLIERLWKVADLSSTLGDFDNNANDTFNAYTINSLHVRLLDLEQHPGGVTSVAGLTGAVTASALFTALGLGAAATRAVGAIENANTGLVTGGDVYSFVNSSVATATATFRGTNTTATTEADFLAWANGLTHDLNDYVFWATTDAYGNTVYKRYKYNGTQWGFEYNLNNSSFTAAQWAAINSGITSQKITGYDTVAAYFTNGVLGTANIPQLPTSKITGLDTALSNINTALNGVGSRVSDLEKMFIDDTYTVDGQTKHRIKVNSTYFEGLITSGFLIGAADGGPGGGGGGGVDLNAMWASLQNTTPDTHATDKFHKNHLPAIVAADGISAGYTLDSDNLATHLNIGISAIDMSKVSGLSTALAGKADASALNDMATQTWVGQNYLPLSGGIMTGVITMPANHQVQWDGGNTMIYGNATEVRVVGTLLVNGNTAYHSGNFTPSDYVKLTTTEAQIITATNAYSVVSFKSRANNESWIGFVGADGTSLGSIGFHSGTPRVYYNSAESIILHQNNVSSYAVTSVNGSGVGSITIDTIDYLKYEYKPTVSADTASFPGKVDVTLFGLTGAPGGDGYVMTFGTNAQLYIDVDPTDIFALRTYGSSGWNSWKTVYHSGNCNDSNTPWTCSIMTINASPQTNYSLYVGGTQYINGQIVSGYSSGAPFSVSSTTKVDYLNADLLDGKHDGELTAKYLFREYVGSDASQGGLVANDVSYDIFDGTSDTEIVKNDNYGQSLALNLPWVNTSYGCRILYGVNTGNLGYQTIGSGTWGTYRTIWHSGNANKSDVNWTCNNLNVMGGTDSVGTSKTATITLQDTYLSHTIKASGGDLIIGNTTDGQNKYIAFYNNNGLHVGIGGGYDLSYMLYVNGSTSVAGVIHATTGVISPGYGNFASSYSSSDQRLKDDIKEIDPDFALEKLMALHPCEWTWNERSTQAGKKGAGFIAQQVSPFFGFTVAQFGEYMSINYDNYHGYEIASIQGLGTRVKNLEKQQLKERLEKLEKAYSKLLDDYNSLRASLRS